MSMSAYAPFLAIVLSLIGTATMFYATLRDMNRDAMSLYDFSCVFWMVGHFIICLFENLYGTYPLAFVNGLGWFSAKKKQQQRVVGKSLSKELKGGFSLPLISPDAENIQRGYRNAVPMFLAALVLAIIPLIIRWKDLLEANKGRTGRATRVTGGDIAQSSSGGAGRGRNRFSRRSSSQEPEEDVLTVGATLKKHEHLTRVLQCQGCSWLLAQALLDLYNAMRRGRSPYGSALLMGLGRRALIVTCVCAAVTSGIIYRTSLKFSGDATLEAWAFIMFALGKLVEDVSRFYEEKIFFWAASTVALLGAATFAAAYSANWGGSERLHAAVT